MTTIGATAKNQIKPSIASKDITIKILNVLASNGVLMALILLIAAVSILRPSVIRWSVLEGIIMQSADLAIVVFPMALLFICKSFDFSIGSVAAFATYVIVQVASEIGLPMGIAAGLLAGAAIGALNGFLISYLKLDAVVVTLGGFTLFRGLTFLLTDGIPYGKGLIPKTLVYYFLGIKKIMYLPIHFYILIFVFFICWWIAHQHKIGERLFAVGGDEQAAYLVGIRVKLVRFLMHTFVGIAAAMAGVVMLFRTGSSLGSIGDGLEFRTLIVVLLGGVSFYGGVGKLYKVLIALFFITILRFSLILTRIPASWIQVTMGVIIVMACALDYYSNKERK